jgi:hypothetical protein
MIRAWEFVVLSTFGIRPSSLIRTMLDECYYQLLSAYVDGELTPRQRAEALRLLEQSTEAREWLRRLQQDAAALRQLPRRKVNRDLSVPVLQIIAERRLKPGRRRRAAIERGSWNLPAWAGFSAAAAALLLVAVGSYFYFTAAFNEKPDNAALAQRQKTQQPETTPKERSTPSPQESQATVAARSAEPELIPSPALEAEPKQPEAVAETEPSRTPDSAILAAPDPVAGMEMFQAAKVTAPQIFKLLDLEQSTSRQRLLETLQKEPAYRMESPCKDSIKAFDRLKTALSAQGIGLILDQTAQARLGVPAQLARRRTHFVIYLENITPEELASLLRQTAGEDRKAEAKKKGDGQLDAVVLNPLTDADRQELCRLLGVKGSRLPDPPAGPLGVDLHKPVSDKTSDQIANALTGKSGMPRPEAGKTTAKPPERLALVLPYNPVRPRPDSAEIKRFLTSRKPLRPGTVQVLLVLRDLGA